MKLLLAMLLVFATDAVAQWTKLPSPTSHPLTGIQMYQSGSGYLSDDSALYGTSDGGAHWNRLNSPAGRVYAIQFSSPGTGVLLVNGDRIYFTDDSAKSWTAATSILVKPPEGLSGIIRASTGRLLVRANSRIVPTSIDSGRNWAVYDPKISWDFLESDYENDSAGLAVVNYTTPYFPRVFLTSDSGRSWAKVGAQPIPLNSGSISLHWVPSQAYVLTYWSYDSLRTFVEHSTDRGASWQRLAAIRANIYSTEFLGSLGLAVGEDSAYETLDGGATWFGVAGPLRGAVIGTSLSSPTEAFAISDSGEVVQLKLRRSIVKELPQHPTLAFSGNRVLVRGSGEGSPLCLYDILGRLVSTLHPTEARDSENTYDLDGVRPGYYFGRVAGSTFRIRTP